MDNSIALIIHRGGTIFDSVVFTPFFVIKCEKKPRSNTNEISTIDQNSAKQVNKICVNKKGYNAYLLSAYIVTLIKSQAYRRAAHKKLSQYLAYKSSDKENFEVILMKLRTPKKQFLDYKWNERVTRIIMERRETDHAMCWLSTLGGAFSALGEEFHHCAEMAGKISIKQFQLALSLGDPLLVARCKLYAALSLIQQDRFKMPRKIVRNVYKFSIDQNDVRLQNMCQGIWAKLKYCRKIQKERHKSA